MREERVARFGQPRETPWFGPSDVRRKREILHMRTFVNFIKNVIGFAFALMAASVMLLGSMMAEAQEPVTRLSVSAPACSLMSEFDLRVDGTEIAADDFSVVCHGDRALVTVRRAVRQDAEISLAGFAR